MFFLPLLILDSDRCSFCPCFSYSRTVVFFLPLLILDPDRCVLSALAFPIVELLWSFCTYLSSVNLLGPFSLQYCLSCSQTGVLFARTYHCVKSTGTFSTTVLPFIQSGWCPLLSYLSFFETFIAFFAIAYHSVNLVGLVSPSLSQCLPFCTFFSHLALSVLELSDVGGTVRPLLRFLIIVGFWWALSPRFLIILVGPFSASLS